MILSNSDFRESDCRKCLRSTVVREDSVDCKIRKVQTYRIEDMPKHCGYYKEDEKRKREQ